MSIVNKPDAYYDADEGVERYLLHSMQPEVEAMFDTILDGGPPVRRLLDVGCASGRTSIFTKSRGVTELVGIEQDPRGCELARQYMDRVIEGDVCTVDVGVPPGYFDAIFLTDILEHVYDPWTTLARYAQLVQTDGHLVVVLPNAGHVHVALGLLGGDFRYTQSGILDSGHIRFFTLKSAQELLDGAGLTVCGQHLRMDQNWEAASSSPALTFFDGAIKLLFDDAKLPPGLRQTHFARKLNFLCQRKVEHPANNLG
ncbi:MAG: class I SAM-dependent methyltransferase [Nannocystaceae bacterium]